MVNLWHPAHAHFFHYFVLQMQARGHELVLTARDKEVTHQLLRSWAIPFTPIGMHAVNTMGKAAEMARVDLRLLKLARRSRPDVIVGISNLYGAQVAKLLGVPSYVFSDTEHAKLENSLAYPVARFIVVPTCYEGDLTCYEDKTVRYEGYHELAYLHPAWYRPNPEVLDLLPVPKGERYVLVRFVSWKAAHDIHQQGFTTADKRRLVRSLSEHAHVIVTSEAHLPTDLEEFRYRLAPNRVHDALAFASLYVGEGATMASESALLGTPSIYVNSLSLGYTTELEKRYGLVTNFRSPAGVVERAVEILADQGVPAAYRSRRQRLLSEKVDVTAFMVKLIEGVGG